MCFAPGYSEHLPSKPLVEILAPNFDGLGERSARILTLFLGARQRKECDETKKFSGEKRPDSVSIRSAPVNAFALCMDECLRVPVFRLALIEDERFAR